MHSTQKIRRLQSRVLTDTQLFIAGDIAPSEMSGPHLQFVASIIQRSCKDALLREGITAIEVHRLLCKG